MDEMTNDLIFLSGDLYSLLRRTSFKQLSSDNQAWKRFLARNSALTKVPRSPRLAWNLAVTNKNDVPKGTVSLYPV
jgi:hypothetical protein